MKIMYSAPLSCVRKMYTEPVLAVSGEVVPTVGSDDIGITPGIPTPGNPGEAY